METHQIKRPDPSAYIELHALIGIALWKAQAFEDALAYFITLVLKLPPSRAEKEVRAVLAKMQSKTLGNLIAELRMAKTSTAVTEFEQRVNQFVDERNWLVHDSFRENGTDLFEPQKLPPLFARLNAISDEALALQKRFGESVVEWTKAQGIDQSTIDAETKKRLTAAGLIGADY
jgi:hypothetical protein